MAVLTAVDVGVAEHVRIVVRDRQMSVNTVVLVDIIMDRVYSSAEILTDSGRIDFLHCWANPVPKFLNCAEVLVPEHRSELSPALFG